MEVRPVGSPGSCEGWMKSFMGSIYHNFCHSNCSLKRLSVEWGSAGY